MLGNVLSVVLLAAPGLAAPDSYPSSPVADPRSREFRGTGALVLGSLAGAAGLVLGVQSAHQLADMERCQHCAPGLPPTAFAAIALNTASFALLPAGTGLRGRWLGSRDALGGAPGRPRVPWIPLGGLVTGGGLVLAAAALSWRLVESPQRSATPWAVLQGGMSMIIVGTSLLVHGLTYRAQVRVLPQLGPHDAGVALVGRF